MTTEQDTSDPEQPRRYIRLIRFLLPIFFINDDIEYKPYEVIDAINSPHKIKRWPVRLFVILTLSLIVAIGYAIWRTFNDSDVSTFSVNVATEQALLTTGHGAMSGWVFDDAEVTLGCPIDDEERAETEVISRFNGKLSVEPEVLVHFRRVEFGDFNIRLYSESGKDVATLEDFDGNSKHSREIGDCILINIGNVRQRSDEGKNIVLPLTGRISSGKELRFSETSTTPLMRGGEISILDKKLITGEHYVVGPFTLALGDYLTIDQTVSDEPEEVRVPAQGFVVIDHEPAMRLIYRDRGSQAVIHRYQMQAQIISNGALNRLLNDSFLSILWFVVIGVYFFNRELLRYMVE